VYLVFSLAILVLVIVALVDVITREDWQVRHLPKMVWILLIIVLPLIGSIVWFIVGRDRSRPPEATPFGDPSRHEAAMETAASRARTEAEIASLEAEIAAAEREERIRQLEAELAAKRRRADPPDAS
jgi:hypothetical protein